MDKAEEDRQVDRINNYRHLQNAINLLDKASRYVNSFDGHPLTINGVDLRDPISNEAMQRIRSGFCNVLDCEIHLLKEEQEKI